MDTPPSFDPDPIPGDQMSGDGCIHGRINELLIVAKFPPFSGGA